MAMNFVATLGVGKGTWGHVARLIQEEDFARVVLVSSEFGRENFAPPKEVDWILINSRSGFEVIKDTIKEKLPEGELVVSFISGSGKEHMALLSALKEADKPFKLVILTGDGTKYY